MVISDWSSDVCSSDLLQPEGLRGRGLTFDLDPALGVAGEPQAAVALPSGREAGFRLKAVIERDGVAKHLRNVGAGPEMAERTSVVSGKSVSVRVDLGGCRLIQKKKKHQQNEQK